MQSIMHPWRDTGKMKTQNMHIRLSENQSTELMQTEKKRMLRLKGTQSIVTLHAMPQGKITVFLHLYGISNNLFSLDGQLFIRA